MKIKIFNNDCIDTMNCMVNYNQKVDLVLTSPPYNTGRPDNSEKVEITTKAGMIFI